VQGLERTASYAAQLNRPHLCEKETSITVSGFGARGRGEVVIVLAASYLPCSCAEHRDDFGTEERRRAGPSHGCSWGGDDARERPMHRQAREERVRSPCV